MVVGLTTAVRARSGSCDDAPSSRWMAVTQCIAKLSDVPLDKMTPSSHAHRLALWFMGPGYDIPVDVDDDHDHTCTWGTSFADVYALLVLRDAANVRNPSWYARGDGDIVVADERDVFQWTRVECRNGLVTGLVLSHAGL